MSGKLKYRSGRFAIAPQFYRVAAGGLQDTPAPVQSAAPPRRRRMNGQVLHCKRSHKQGNLALALDSNFYSARYTDRRIHSLELEVSQTTRQTAWWQAD